MDLGKALVSALLSEGIDSYRLAMAGGLSTDRVVGEARTALEMVIKYAKETGKLPSAETVSQLTGVVLSPTTDPSSFLIKHVNNKHMNLKIQALASELTRITSDNAKAISGVSGEEALALVASSLGQIRSEFVGTLGVENLTAANDVVSFYDRIKAGERGIPSPWPSLNEATLGFWPEDLVLFAARQGTGKCLSADTLIIDPISGIPRTIEFACTQKDFTHATSWSDSCGTHSLPIKAKHDNKVKRCRKLTTQTGRSVDVTDEHPILTPDGWKRADAIAPHTTIALPARMPFPSKPQPLDINELTVIAGLLAEGGTTDNRLSFTNNDPKMIGLMRKAASRLGAKLQAVSGRKGQYDLVGKGPRKAGSNPALNLARIHGIYRKLAKHKVIPDAVWSLDAEGLSYFLSIFWMCDGYVDAVAPAVCLASEKLVREIQSLLLRFGIQSRVCYKRATCRGKVLDSWRLTVIAASLSSFQRHIPLWGHKARSLCKLAARSRNPNVGMPRVSAELMLRIKSESGAVGFRNPNGDTLRRIAARLGRKIFTPRDLFRRHGSFYSVSLPILKVYCEEFHCADKYGWLCNSDLFWDRVSDVRDVGEKPIFDLTVDPTSCFVANDILVHNSWVSILLAAHAWNTPDIITGKRNKVLLITTEMSRMRLRMRFLASRLRLPYSDFTHGKLNAFQEQRFRDEVQKLEGADGLYIVGGGFDFRIDSVEAAIDACGANFVILDGVYLIKSPGVSRSDQMANTFNEMKRLAKRKQIVMAVTTQFNREVKKEQASTVQAESIALSDTASWNADLIFGLVQTTEMKAEKRMIIKPLKVREGIGTEVECRWDFGMMDFSELTKEGGGGGEADEKGTSTANPFDATNPDGGPLSQEDEDIPF